MQRQVIQITYMNPKTGHCFTFRANSEERAEQFRKSMTARGYTNFEMRKVRARRGEAAIGEELTSVEY